MKNKNIFTSFCTLTFTKFPFDTQTCWMEIATFTTDTYIHHADFIAPPSNRIFVGKNLVWKDAVTSVVVEEDGPYTRAFFKIEMNRRSTYHIQLVVMPTALLTVLQLGVFFLPINAAERAGYSITVVLAMQVAVASVYNSIPVTSEPVYLGYYVSACEFLGAFITIYTMFAYRAAVCVRSSTLMKKLEQIDIIVGILLTLLTGLANAFYFVYMVYY